MSAPRARKSRRAWPPRRWPPGVFESRRRRREIDMRAIALLLFTSGLASAQALTDAPSGTPPTPAPAPAPAGPTAAAAPIQLGPVTFTGSLRARFYAWDWFQPASGQNQYEYSGILLRLNFADKLNAW